MKYAPSPILKNYVQINRRDSKTKVSYLLGIQYSDWIPVPENEDRDTWIDEIVEGKKFQIMTDKKIDSNSDIRWSMNGLGWFTFHTTRINAQNCHGGYILKGSEGFTDRAGTMTFLKSTIQLQVWFDDVLEVNWVYEDNKDGTACRMKKPMTGLKFKTPFNKYDKVSKQYRYQIGNYTPLTCGQNR